MRPLPFECFNHLIWRSGVPVDRTSKVRGAEQRGYTVVLVGGANQLVIAHDNHDHFTFFFSFLFFLLVLTNPSSNSHIRLFLSS